MRRQIVVGVLALGPLLGSGCIRDVVPTSGLRLSSAGETCGRTADCKAPLRCRHSTCVVAGTAPVESMSQRPSSAHAPSPMTDGQATAPAETVAPKAKIVSPPKALPMGCNETFEPFEVHGGGTRAGAVRYYRAGGTFSRTGGEGGLKRSV